MPLTSSVHVVTMSDVSEFQVMQSQMTGMQSSLDRILSALQTQGNQQHQQAHTSPTDTGSAHDNSLSYPQRTRYVHR